MKSLTVLILFLFVFLLNASNLEAASVYNGVYVTGAPSDMTKINQFETNVGKKASIIMFYTGWGNQYNDFYPSIMDNVRNHGSIPMITWEPWAYSVNDPRYSLANIINGNYDTYIRSWAQKAKVWGNPFFLRFAHEMNGNWYSWSEQVNGNKAGQYVQAWRHVYDIFREEGVTNATWVWSPNIEYSGSIALEGLYPGDAYVDWTGMDGYNHGTGKTGFTWQSFSTLFKPTYDNILRITDKPIMITEIASSEVGGSKSSWITDAYTTQIPLNFPKLRGVIWFNEMADPALDWRIESSPSSLSAYKTALASNYFDSNRYSTLTQSPIAPPNTISSSPTASPTQALVSQFEAETMSVSPLTSGGVFSDMTASGESGLVLWSNGTATKTIYTQGKQLAIIAKADQCNGAPRLIVTVDNITVLSTTIMETSWKLYQIPIQLSLGSHSVSITFDNDYLDMLCDRNLKIDKGMFSNTSITPTQEAKKGDANNDGKVDGIDYITWLSHYNETTTSGPSYGDFNNDTKVDGVDYIIWLSNYGS